MITWKDFRDYRVGKDFFDHGNDSAGLEFNTWLANKWPKLEQVCYDDGKSITSYDEVLGYDKEKDIDT